MLPAEGEGEERTVNDSGDDAGGDSDGRRGCSGIVPAVPAAGTAASEGDGGSLVIASSGVSSSIANIAAGPGASTAAGTPGDTADSRELDYRVSTV